MGTVLCYDWTFTLVLASMEIRTPCIILAGLTISSINGGLSVNNVVCGTSDCYTCTYLPNTSCASKEHQVVDIQQLLC